MEKLDLPVFYTRRDSPKLEPSFCDRHPVICLPIALLGAIPISVEWVVSKFRALYRPEMPKALDRYGINQ